MKTNNTPEKVSDYTTLHHTDLTNIIEALSFAIHTCKTDGDLERVEEYRKIIKDINNRHE